MTKTEALNKFLAEAVASMDEETRAAWDSLSDFERKTIAASGFFFAEALNEAN